MYMNYKYLCLVLIVCFAVSFFFCGCGNVNRAKIVIKHESKYAKAKMKKKVSNVIDLSDGKQVNFDYPIGPQDVSTPSLGVINLDRY